MEDEIKKERDNSLFTKSRLSFPGCPYGCVNGRVFNVALARKEACPYCSEKRLEFIQEDTITDTMDSSETESLSELLRVPRTLTGIRFDFDTVIPDSAKKTLDPIVLTKVKDELTDIINKLQVGELPSHSILINLGSRVNDVNLLYPLLIASYKAGFTTAPLATPYHLSLLRSQFESEYYINDTDIKFGDNYKDYIDCDFCVIAIDTGVTSRGVDVVKGIMQQRAYKQKPTVILTNSWSNKITYLSTDDGHFSYTIAKLISVKYLNKDKEDEIVNTDTSNTNTEGVTPTVGTYTSVADFKKKNSIKGNMS